MKKSSLAIVLLLLSFILISCQGKTESDNTGGLTFHLEWQQATTAPHVASIFKAAPAGVVTVRMSVSAADMTTMQSSFPAADGTGSISGVPIGSNRTITFEGIDGSGTVIYQGSVSGITVTAGQTANCGTVVMQPTTGTIPLSPSNVVAVPGNSQNVISWSTATYALSYNIYWSTSAVVNKQIGTKVAGITATAYTHTGLTNGTMYYYVVTSVSGSYESAESAVASAAPGTVPSAPTNVYAAPGNTQNIISWTTATGVTSYNIYWSLSSGVTKSNGTKIANATSPYSHTGLTNGTTYYYVASAVNAFGESAASSQTSATPTVPGGLVAYYPFSGNANDASGNGNNGTVSGATLTTDRFGNANSAYSFNGSQVISANSISPQYLTVSAWVKPTSLSQLNSVAGQGGNYKDTWQLYTSWENNNSFTSAVRLNSQWYKVVDSTPTVLNTWVHLSMTFDGNTLKAYKNGQLIGQTTTPSQPLPSDTSPLSIGDAAAINGAQNYYGSIDDVRIYNRALSATEIQGLYQLPSPDSWQTTTTTGAPSARTSSSAVWTGSEIIVWGGYDGTTYFNAGYRYNPVTDSWGAAIATLNAPEARIWHTAVWSGNEMLIWGGQNNSGTLLNNGGRYNPATDSWGAAPTLLNAPTARGAHRAVWTGTEMIVWGGKDNPATQAGCNTGGRYNPSTDTWKAGGINTSGAPSGREGPAAIWTGTEMIVWGGYSNTPLATGGRYNPTTDTWGAGTAGTGAPAGRVAMASVWTGTEMIIWGGFDVSGNLNTGYRYNPASDTWSPIQTSTVGAPSARQYPAFVWTGSQMVIWGGSAGASLNTGGRYTP